jgi:hypothetical protein
MHEWPFVIAGYALAAATVLTFVVASHRRRRQLRRPGAELR